MLINSRKGRLEKLLEKGEMLVVMALALPPLFSFLSPVFHQRLYPPSRFPLCILYFLHSVFMLSFFPRSHSLYPSFCTSVFNSKLGGVNYLYTDCFYLPSDIFGAPFLCIIGMDL